MFHYVYALQNLKNGSLYIGYNADLKKRLKRHNSGGGEYIKKYMSWQLIHHEAYHNEKDDKRREKYLKTNQGSRLLKRMLKEYFMIKNKGFKIQNFKFLAFVFSFSLFAFILAMPVFAMELYFEPRIQELGIGQEFQVDLMINPQDQEINAVEANIVFPEDLVEVKNIEDGGSILTFWVEEPTITRTTTNGNELRFAGIIPGGFKGIMSPFKGTLPGRILSLTVMANKEGMGELALEEAQVLLHDGKGTKAEFLISNFQFSIREDVKIRSVESMLDTISPEPFTPEIARDSDMFKGKWFLVFATQDKLSGIDYYAIHESRRMKKQITMDEWIEAESPYVLKDQELRSYIYVKAVDKSRNERIVVVEPRYPVKWYEICWTWGIILLALFIVILTWRKNTKCEK